MLDNQVWNIGKMQKSKSASLSQKEKQKIIKIIHSKVTPLRFKFKKADSHTHTHSSLLPQLDKSQKSELDQPQMKKRISLSTYIEIESPFNHNNMNQPRQSVISTQNIKKQEEFLAALLNQSSIKQKLSHSNGLTEPLNSQSTKLKFENTENLMTQINLLQKKKMLKGLKYNIQKKKTQLLLQIINQRQIQKQQKKLLKRYNPNFKHTFKQKHQRNTQACEILHLYSKQRKYPLQTMSKNQLFSVESKNKPLRNSLDFCIEYKDSKEEPQNNKISQSSINQHKEAMKLKDFIDFFRDDQQEAKKIRLDQCLKLRNQKTSKFLYHQSLVHSIENPSYQFSMRKISMPLNKNTIFADSATQKIRPKPRCGFINKTVHFRLDQQKQVDDNLQYISPTLANAKLRMKSNHKKIISLGKMKKTSSLGKNSKYDLARIL